MRARAIIAAITVFATSSALAPSASSTGDASAGAQLVQANGCAGCHGAQFQGGLGPALYGIEHRLSAAQIASHIKNPTAPMPNNGFTDTQIAGIVAYISGLDGSAGVRRRPVVVFKPSVPTEEATIAVTFSGTPPRAVRAQPVMQMAKGPASTPTVTLHPSATDPHVFTGRVRFSMGGPWAVQIEYDGNTMSVPLNVGS
ncbi:MAG TPA: c-type cytochrome [Candidatus Binatia bacterium]|nr:c-type cytochrome [Candidatus Binatia bacterium]